MPVHSHIIDVYDEPYDNKTISYLYIFALVAAVIILHLLIVKLYNN